jgi:hypothetical protein
MCHFTFPFSQVPVDPAGNLLQNLLENVRKVLEERDKAVMRNCGPNRRRDATCSRNFQTDPNAADLRPYHDQFILGNGGDRRLQE